MLPTQRRQAILAEVRQARAVSADDLARRFGVSLETIRRDLRGLRDAGLLERVYGGALSIRSSEGSFAARSTLHSERKQAIARLAATLIAPGDTIVIDVGTTALEVARALPFSFRGRVLTNSVPAAMELAARDEIELHLCGGQVRPGDAACHGAQAESFFAEFYADKAFLGSGGVHARAGLTDYHPPEVVTRRTTIAADCTVLMGELRGSGHDRDRPGPRGRGTGALRLPPAVRPLAAPLRVVRGGVLLHLDHHRDLHHLRLCPGHGRHPVHLDLAHRDRRPSPRGPGLRRAVGPGPVVGLLL